MTRLVDPIHLFDHLGRSVMSEAHLADRVSELEAENELLRQRITRLQKRIEDQSLSD